LGDHCSDRMTFALATTSTSAGEGVLGGGTVARGPPHALTRTAAMITVDGALLAANRLMEPKNLQANPRWLRFSRN